MNSECRTRSATAHNVAPAYTDARSEEAEVCFAPGPAVPARVGESLLKVAEANQVALRSGCRMGLCGADPVQIIEGEDNLSPPSAAECAILRRLGLPLGCRMACSARVRGPVTVAPLQRARPPAPPRRPDGPYLNPAGAPALSVPRP